MKKRVNSDMIGGVLGLALAGAFYLAREANWSFWSAVFPNVVIAIIATLSALLVVKAFVRPAMLPLFAEGSPGNMVVVAVVLLAWSVAFSSLGTLLSSFLGFVFLAWYLSRGTAHLGTRQLLIGIVVIVTELAVFYVIFTRVLNVPLPRGVLF